MKIVALLTGLFLNLPSSLFAWWGPRCFNNPYWQGGRHWMGGNFFGGGLIMWIITLAFLGILLFFGIKYFKGNKIDILKKETPIDILKSRYAKGEIDKDTFNEMKNELGKT